MMIADKQEANPVRVEANNILIRLAETEAEIEASQRLRYRVFCEEMHAKPSPEMEATGREFDAFDPYCDHLVVFDRKLGEGPEALIGTYRLMRREAAARLGRFYTAAEYDISALIAYPGEILELGRSCIDRAYRTGTTMQMLWRGIAEYVLQFGVEVMFGCASLHGTNPDDMALPLSYLYHHHLAPPALRPRTVEGHFVEMNRMPANAIDRRKALAALPPLIKGYLRLGGMVGDGAYVDEEFNTTDVCIIVKTDLVTERYYKHYTREDGSRGEDQKRAE